MAHTLLPDPNALCLDRIAVEGDVIVFHVATTVRAANCPACGCLCARIHSRYRRTLQDLPWQGNTVRFLLTVPKYFCDNKDCPRKIFAQRIDRVAQRYRRKTTRLDDLLQRLTWRIGAAEAARLARLVGLILSPDAALYRFKRSACPQSSDRAPEALGIDDFAFRRGHSYGTILINLKTRTPVDLLPDRERASVEKWLRKHPGAKVVSRDRSAIYADAIREAAPEATAVADRFHVLKNLMETFQAQIGKENKTIREALIPQTASLEDAGPVTQARRVQRRSQQSRQSRFEKWERARQLHGQGYFKKEIARLLDLDVHTVRHYLRADTFPERRCGSPVNGPLTPYKEYILRRWEEGCRNALQLWREVREQGYPGCTTAVRDFVVPLRQPGMTPAIRRAERAVPSPRALSWLLALPERRTEEQTALVEKVCAACPTLGLCRDLVLSFQDILRRRADDELDGWLERAMGSGLSAFTTYVRGIRADMEAVRAAFALEWSNGPTEGHVNRLKFLKRQGYGRAGFDLLRRRVLPLAA
jgi:transposase